MNLSFLSSKNNSFQETGASTKGKGAAAHADDTPPPGGAEMSTKSSNEDDSTLATPRSVQTKDEFDDPDFNDLMEGGKASESQFLGGLNRFINKQAKAFVRNFIDYGPPYTKKPFDPVLVNECSKPVMNHIELHRLLNNRLDPNLPDPEDLYYYPIHWCARNIHFMALKMLMRAGAKVNVTNELGCTPLDMCVMMKLPPDKRKDQLKMAQYLLENGADPNNRDKGGFSAIDQAAINQDLELIEMLLEFGANVLRENHTLVAKRHHILRHVYDPDCYRVLYERLVQEQAKAEERRIVREKMLSEVAAERYHVKLHQALDKRKQKRLDREAARDTSAKTEVIMQQRHKHLAAEMEANLKTKEKVLQQQGVWTKDDVDHWSFTVKSEDDRINSESLYAANFEMMDRLKVRNSKEKYNERWKQATGNQGVLEMHWTKAEAFTLLPPIPGTPFITTPHGKKGRKGARDDGSVGSAEGSLGGHSGSVATSKGKAGGGIAAGRATPASAGGEGLRAPPAEQLQLEHGGAHRDHAAHNKGGGILKNATAAKDTDNALLEQHAFGGMFVGTGGAALVPAGANSSGLRIVKRAAGEGTRTGNGGGEDDGIDQTYLEETRHLPNVDVQYADSDDEQLYDEDLDNMLKELTTF